MTEDRKEYYQRRALEARVLARSARDEDIRAIHLDMAERYESLAAALDESDERPN